jgi:hypothetical protein
MMHTFLFPDGIMYLIVKLCVLALVLLLWLAATSAPAA